MIPFTQYLLPDGRTKEEFVERPKEIEEKAKGIIERGHRFETEVLTTGQVSLTIYNLDKEEDVAIEISENSPALLDAIDKMILNFKG